MVSELLCKGVSFLLVGHTLGSEALPFSFLKIQTRSVSEQLWSLQLGRG